MPGKKIVILGREENIQRILIKEIQVNKYYRIVKALPISYPMDEIHFPPLVDLFVVHVENYFEARHMLMMLRKKFARKKVLIYGPLLSSTATANLINDKLLKKGIREYAVRGGTYAKIIEAINCILKITLPKNGTKEGKGIKLLKKEPIEVIKSKSRLRTE